MVATAIRYAALIYVRSLIRRNSQEEGANAFAFDSSDQPPLRLHLHLHHWWDICVPLLAIFNFSQAPSIMGKQFALNARASSSQNIAFYCSTFWKSVAS